MKFNSLIIEKNQIENLLNLENFNNNIFENKLYLNCTIDSVLCNLRTDKNFYFSFLEFLINNKKDVIDLFINNLYLSETHFYRDNYTKEKIKNSISTYDLVNIFNKMSDCILLEFLNGLFISLKEISSFVKMSTDSLKDEQFYLSKKEYEKAFLEELQFNKENFCFLK